MTSDEWARAYAERSGTTVEQLREWGREVRPCHCDYERCEGWQMAHIKEAQWAADNGIASAEELEWLAWPGARTFG